MIIVQDCIEVAAQDLERLQTLFEEHYRPEAQARGLIFLEAAVSPPVRLQSAACQLWLRWQVADAAAWWAMRVQSGAPGVAAFWQEVDSFALKRERLYLTPEASSALPPVEDISAYRKGVQGYRQTAQLRLRESLSETDKAAFLTLLRDTALDLEGVEQVRLGENIAPGYAVGDLSWDLLFSSAEAAAAAQQSPLWLTNIQPALEANCSAIHALGLNDNVDAGVRAPELQQGVKRTAYFRLLPHASLELARRFEQDLLEMPAHISDIRNWRLSRAQVLPWSSSDCPDWSYVWEQEFATLEGLTGPYMIHPHHWAHIDRWFDPESGVQAVDTYLSHAFSPLSSSLLICEAR